MNIRKKPSVSVVLACMGCLLASIQQRDAVAQAVSIRPDLVYGHKDGLALTMDMMQPSNPNGGAVLFMVSGGWVSRWSPPNQMKNFLSPYLDQGLTVFAVRHGSSPRYGIPDAVADVRRAVRFVRSRAKEFRIDAERLGVLGMSAGGHLALVLATTGDDGNPTASDPLLRQSSRVAAVAALVPPTDLTVMVWSSDETLPSYKNFPALDLNAQAAAEYSPRLHVTKDDAAALIISGTQDKLVPAKHGTWIAEAYQREALPHKLMLLDADHGLQGKQAEAIQAVVEWFRIRLAPRD